MVPGPGCDALVDYTAWQREQWLACCRAEPQALRAGTGAHGDGRFPTTGDLIKHVFTVERRYVQRLSGHPLSDFADIPSHDAEGLFGAGRASRGDLHLLLTSFAGDWDAERHFAIPGYADLTATPRKVVLHLLVHEVRHWAQIATICRIGGHTIPPQDVLASSVWGGTFTP
jgi:uncharacterized damage-inducible protein DinB